jgi:hypothetical protein
MLKGEENYLHHEKTTESVISLHSEDSESNLAVALETLKEPVCEDG